MRKLHKANSIDISNRAIFLILSILALCCTSFSGFAATIDDARASHQAGQHKRALAEINSVLNKAPKDTAAIFLKAQILTEDKQPAAAIESYNQLISLEKHHLEAYNNLAAIYAQQNQLKLASETLEAAIKSDPIYNTIYTNLRAIYIDISKKHYREALKLKPDDKETQLVAINTQNNDTPILSDSAQSSARSSLQSSVNTTVDANTIPEPSVPTKVVPIAQVSPPKKEVIQTETKAEPIKIAKTKPALPKPATLDPSIAAVKKTLLSWAGAWSSKDVDKYVNAYRRTYAPSGKTHNDWVGGRRWNFKNKQYIKVSLSGLKISKEGQNVIAKFKQNYESDTYKDVTQKTLLFVKQGKQWVIERETSNE